MLENAQGTDHVESRYGDQCDTDPEIGAEATYQMNNTMITHTTINVRRRTGSGFLTSSVLASGDSGCCISGSGEELDPCAVSVECSEDIAGLRL